jgi:hypothetical protein
MNLKILLSIAVFFNISNGINAMEQEKKNATHRLIFGTGSNIKENMKSNDLYSSDLIEPTQNDITIDIDKNVIPTITGNMGDYKIYSQNILGTQMAQKNIKQFDEIIFEHTPAPEGEYVLNTIDPGEFTAFGNKVLKSRENKIQGKLANYLKIFNGTYYTLFLKDLLKSGGILTIKSRRFNYDEYQIWATWCGELMTIAKFKMDKNDTDRLDNMTKLEKEAISSCNRNPEEAVKSYYKSALKEHFDHIKIEFIEDSGYIGVKGQKDFKYIKVTATRRPVLN